MHWWLLYCSWPAECSSVIVVRVIPMYGAVHEYFVRIVIIYRDILISKYLIESTFFATFPLVTKVDM